MEVGIYNIEVGDTILNRDGASVPPTPEPEPEPEPVGYHLVLKQGATVLFDDFVDKPFYDVMTDAISIGGSATYLYVNGEYRTEEIGAANDIFERFTSPYYLKFEKAQHIEFRNITVTTQTHPQVVFESEFLETLIFDNVIFLETLMFVGFILDCRNITTLQLDLAAPNIQSAHHTFAFSDFITLDLRNFNIPSVNYSPPMDGTICDTLILPTDQVYTEFFNSLSSAANIGEILVPAEFYDAYVAMGILTDKIKIG